VITLTQGFVPAVKLDGSILCFADSTKIPVLSSYGPFLQLAATRVFNEGIADVWVAGAHFACLLLDSGSLPS